MTILLPKKKKPTTVGLNKKKYELNYSVYSWSKRAKEQTKPEQLIFAFKEIKPGIKFWTSDWKKTTAEERKWMKDKEKKFWSFLDEDEEDYEFEIIHDLTRPFTVKEIRDEGDEVVFIAEGKPYESPKQEIEDNKADVLQKVVERIDFKYDQMRKNLFKTLANVFTPEILEDALKTNDIEILMFDRIMYLKIGKKAYRL